MAKGSEGFDAFSFLTTGADFAWPTLAAKAADWSRVFLLLILLSPTPLCCCHTTYTNERVHRPNVWPKIVLHTSTTRLTTAQAQWWGMLRRVTSVLAAAAVPSSSFRPSAGLGRAVAFMAREMSSGAAAASASAADVQAPSKAGKAGQSIVVEARKKNIAQSPWKMNFLVKLVRGKWVPDALAQLKFTPKRRGEDVSKIVQRAISISSQFHQTIPEELMVKEIFITKGLQQKRSRIMGRGRTGYGYKRSSHVTVKVEKIDFEALMLEAKTANQRAKWAKRLQMVNDIKSKSIV